MARRAAAQGVAYNQPQQARGWLQQPVTAIKGVGPQVALRLQRLRVRTVQDLCLHLPLRYEDRTLIVPIAGLRANSVVQVEGFVTAAETRGGRRPSLHVELTDETGSVGLRFFHFSTHQKVLLTVGARLRCYGEVRWVGDALCFIHPDYQLLREVSTPLPAALTPVYPATDGLGQATLRRLVARAMDGMAQFAATQDVFVELLPQALLDELRLPGLTEALLYLHAPPPDAPLALLSRDRHPAQLRIVLEELLAHHLSLRRLRQEALTLPAPVLRDERGLQAALMAALPFVPTGAQRRALAQIHDDMLQPHPMLRLLQGDVGSGKTLVAVGAIMQTVGAGCQAALMAPTELLAEQHARNLAQWLAPHGVEVARLCASQARKLKQGVLARIAGGDLAVIVGTHALLQDEVAFHKLGLVVVDEQHRFGVEQRLALRAKGARAGWHPHQLIMSATPIPRTLAMVAYSDLDVSVLDELPPGRQPVDTVLVSQARRDEVVARIRERCALGHQAYWVCSLVEESEQLQARAASETADWLRGRLPGLSIGLVHGRLRSEEKDAVMRAFYAGEVHVLVATTVIEVGVDVPKASVMIIENPERLGLAQLHQLRGRVGRGSDKSACVLLYGEMLSTAARERLLTLRATSDGFEIARRDLELRGPGEVLGTRQSGAMALRVADLLRDQHCLPWVEQAAALLFSRYPERVEPLINRWLPGVTAYGSV
jgi:ATP-dependent DNA helicase RecG